MNFPYHQWRLALFAILFLLSLGGCALNPPKKPVHARVEGFDRPFFIGQIIRVRTGEVISFDQLISRACTADVVFIGEVHDNPEHHLIQVQVLQTLMMRRDAVTLAMECFQNPQQSIIDAYLKGAITESEYLEKIDWARLWGFDYSLYRPLILTIKKNKGRISAINAPAHIIKRTAKQGLDGLSPEERRGLATDIDLEDTAHRKQLKNIYQSHSHKNLKSFDFFYQAQCARDDTMAENIAEIYNTSQRFIVVIAGNGHVVKKYGIPNRLKKRMGKAPVTIMLMPMEESLSINKETADYVWLTGRFSRKSFTFHPKSHPRNRSGSKGHGVRVQSNGIKP